MISRKLVTFLALAMPFVVSHPAVAQTIYVADDVHQLLAYDVGTGTFTPIGSPMSVLMGGMGCADPTAGVLYGTDNLSPVSVYAIDASTAAITLLTTATGHTAVGSTVGPDGNVWAIVNDPSGLLYVVDPISPLVADIGFTGFSNEGQPSFDAALNFYTFSVGGGSDSLYLVDPSTAATTAIGNVGFSVYAAAFCNGTFYGFTGGATHNVIAIDPSTGAGTVITAYGPPVTGSVQAAACCTP